MAKVSQNDAAGGSGSLLDRLRGVAVDGLSRAVDGRLARRYNVGTDNERMTDTGQPAGAPQGSASAFANPATLAIVGAVALIAVIYLVSRK